jgi:hypothetical protein
MAQPTLEERVAALGREMAELRAALANGAAAKDWRSTIGMFSGDEVMKQIEEQGRKWREAERRKARRRPVKKRSAKS